MVAVLGGGVRVRPGVGEGGDERRGDAEDQARSPTDVFTGDVFRLFVCVWGGCF